MIRIIQRADVFNADQGGMRFLVVLSKDIMQHIGKENVPISFIGILQTGNRQCTSGFLMSRYRGASRLSLR